MSVELVDLALVKTDGGTQPRANLELLVVQEYVDAMERGDTFPPVKLVYDGNAYWPYDGFHRIEACRASNRPMIRAEVLQGTVEDARWMSCAANATHGLRRTNLDKRRAVVTALKHERAARLSDRKIADHCGVSDKTVAAIRAELVGTAEIPQLETRVGQDGKERRLPSKPEPVPDEAGAPTNLVAEYRGWELEYKGAWAKVAVKWFDRGRFRFQVEYRDAESGFGGPYSLPLLDSTDGVETLCRGLALLVERLREREPVTGLAQKQVAKLLEAASKELCVRSRCTVLNDALWLYGTQAVEGVERPLNPAPNDQGEYLPWEAYDWEESHPVIGVEQSRNIWIRMLEVAPEHWAVGWAIKLGGRAHVVLASKDRLSDCGGQDAAREMVEWIEERFTGFPETVKSEARAVLRWLAEDFGQYTQEVDLEDPEPATEPEPEEPKLKLVKPSAAFCRQTRDAIELLADNAGDWPGVGVNLRVDVTYEKVLRAMKALTLIRDAIRPARAS